jgi:hypothetical protein
MELVVATAAEEDAAAEEDMGCFTWMEMRRRR